MNQKISIVVPCFNEQEVIQMTYQRLKDLDLGCYQKEILFIDDGSRDQTLVLLKQIAAKDAEVKVLGFSRNFGHQLAVTAGMDYAQGDAVVIIDADLQDPPELIPQMIEKWKEGYDVVYGKRLQRKGETAFKKATAWCYYRVLNAMGAISIPKDTGDFRLLDRKVVDAMKSMGEHNRFLRGMSAWAGYSQCPVEYVRDERAAGETKYTMKKMLKLAGDGITSFSDKPLKLPFAMGAGLFGLSFLYLICAIVLAAIGIWPVSYALFGVVFCMLSVIFLWMGLMGMYLGRIYDEAKKRPLYILEEKINF